MVVNKIGQLMRGFCIQNPIEMIFVLLEKYQSVEQHWEDGNYVSKVLSPKNIVWVLEQALEGSRPQIYKARFALKMEPIGQYIWSFHLEST